MEDRFVAFREMNERYQLQKALSDVGPEPTLLQLLFIQNCIEQAKRDPEKLTLKIIQDVRTTLTTRYSDTSN